MRIVIALIASLALASCGGGDNGESPIQNAAPVASASPAAGKAWVDVVAKTPEGGVRQGNPDAPIKVIEYGSRSCPACAAFALQGVEPMRAKYIASGQVSYEFRDFMIHPQDAGLAIIGRCVPDETFFPILDQMYAQQQSFNERAQTITEADYAALQNMQPLPQARRFLELLGYLDFMKQRGVPQASLDQCLSTQANLDRFAKEVEAGQKKGVDSTPTFYVNDRKVQGGWTEVEDALRGAGAR